MKAVDVSESREKRRDGGMIRLFSFLLVPMCYGACLSLSLMNLQELFFALFE